MDTVAGNGTAGFSGDFGPATSAQINTYGNGGVAAGPDGAVYISDESNYRIRKVSSAMPNRGASDIIIPSRDGTELYEFDRYWRHAKTLHGLTGAVLYQFEYDENGLLVTVTDGYGNTTAIERLPGGEPSAIAGPYGHRTTLNVDGEGYFAAITNPAGEAVQFEYSDTGLMTRMTDAMGNIHAFSYDALGRLVLDENPAGGSLALERTAQTQGFQITASTDLNRTTGYRTEYLPSGQTRATHTFPTGAQSVSAVESDGSTKTELPDGVSVETVPGGDPRFGLMAPYEITRTVKTPSGLTLNRTMTRKVTLSNPYDPLTLTSQTDVFTLNGNPYTSVTDVSARQIDFLTPEGRSSVTHFDGNGRLTRHQTSGLEAFYVDYDALGRPDQYRRGDMIFDLSYNPQGRIFSVTDAAGRSTEFLYDAADRVSEIKTPLEKRYLFGYDAGGNPTGLTMPDGKHHGFTYNEQNLLSSYAPPSSSGTPPSYSFSYDTEKNLTQFGFPSGKTLGFSYGTGGRRSQISYPEADIAFRYADSTARLFQVERSSTAVPPEPSQQIEYGYDGALRTGLKFSGLAEGVYGYTYDNNFLLSEMNFASGSDSVLIAMARDDDGLLTGYGNFLIARDADTGNVTAIGDDGSGTHKLQVLYDYDALGRLSGKDYRVNGNRIFAFDLLRDSSGRMTQRTDTLPGGGVHTRAYEYDLDGQLALVTKNGDPVESYAYDMNSNRISTGAFQAHYDDQDRITDQGGISYQHDPDGYMVQRGADSLVYSTRGELLRATAGGATVVEYAYDGFGRRVGRKVDSGNWQQYFYGNPLDPFLVTATRNADGVLTTYFYDDLTHLIAFNQGTQWYYTATDQVGTPLVISDADGNIIKTLDYDSCGVMTNDNNPAFELPIWFAGGLADPLTGLVRFGSRDYAPEIARWTGRDPILFDGGQFNLYVYVHNNPVNFRDPSGASSEDGWGIEEALFALWEGRKPGGPYDRAREWEYAFNRRWRQDWKKKGPQKCFLDQRKMEMENPLLVDIALGINDLFTEFPKTSLELLKGVGIIQGDESKKKRPMYVGGNLDGFVPGRF
jgi:RHS repeat-associated protein